VLLAMGFQPSSGHRTLPLLHASDTELGVCVIAIDEMDDDIWEEELIHTLDYYGISLAEFWNLYDAT
jgi:hypothetical protein